MSDAAPPTNLRRLTIGMTLIALALLAACALRLFIGSSSIGLPTGELADYIWQERLTRLVMALFVGAALAVSGVALQSLLRNPLAEPYILGLSTGAGAGIMVQAYVFFLITGHVAAGANGLGALAGAAAAMFIVFILGQRKGVIDPLGLLLTGVVLSTICGALILMMNYLVGPGGIRDNLARWMMGSLDAGADRTLIIAVGGMTLLGLIVLATHGRAMDVASSSDAETMSMGVNLPRLRIILFAVASVLAAGAVVLAGPIAFVGLICPHIARLALGPSHRPLLVASAMLGAALVIAADTASAALNLALGIGLMPIGVFTALVGGPVFLWMLRPQLGKGSGV